MSEKFCLKWNDFQSNIKASFSNLRNYPDFADVTLACEDDQQIKVHRVILASLSPFFSNVLKTNKHSHPLIYMRGVKTKDLASVVDFMYYGEVNILQDDLNSFLVLADDLKLKGLTEIPNSEQNYPNRTKESDLQDNNHIAKIKHAISNTIEQESEDDNFDYKTDTTVANIVFNNQEKVTTYELKEKLDALMDRQEDGQWKCNVCGKISIGGNKNDLRKHVEAKHTDGISYPCDICDKTYR